MYIISNIEEVLAKNIKRDHPDWSQEQVCAEIDRLGEDFVYKDKIIEAGIFDGLFNKKLKLINEIMRLIELRNKDRKWKGCHFHNICSRGCGSCNLGAATRKLALEEYGVLVVFKSALEASEPTNSQMAELKKLDSMLGRNLVDNLKPEDKEALSFIDEMLDELK
jgi:hypothetical protein